MLINNALVYEKLTKISLSEYGNETLAITEQSVIFGNYSSALI